MGLSVKAVQQGLSGLRKLCGAKYVGAMKPRYIPTPKSAANLRYAPELTHFTGEVSKKVLNKSDVLARYASENGFVLDEVSTQFAQAEKYLDDVSVQRLLRLTNEGKIDLFSVVKKRSKEDWVISLKNKRGASTVYTERKPKGVLNYFDNPETSKETAGMLKQLLALQEQGKITPEAINHIMKMQNGGFGVQCNEYIEALKKGLASEEQLATAMLMMENRVPLKMLNPENFKNFDAEELRYAANKLRAIDDSYAQSLLLKISSHLSQTKPINFVPQEISSAFIRDFDRVTEAFAKSGKTMDELVSAGGIQLSYSRHLFKENVLSQIAHLPEAEQAKILSRFGLEKGVGGRLNGLPAYIDNPQGLSSVEEAVNKEIGKFLHENNIVLPKGFEEYQAPLEEICRVFPEFKYVIGANAHSIHTKPIAEHMLMAFQENIRNPLYQTLNASDRRVLGISTLLHDINKIETTKDAVHALTSSQTAQAIVGRMNGLSVAEKDRIIDLVKNHHWLEGVQSGTGFSEQAVKDIAIQFRSGNDFTMAKIFAESDLKAVNSHYFDGFGTKLNSPMIKAIENEVLNIHSMGKPVFTADITLEKGIAQGAVQKVAGEGENAVTNWVTNAKAVGLDTEAIIYHSSADASGYERAMQGATHGGEGIFSSVFGGNGYYEFYKGNYALGFRSPNNANICYGMTGKTGFNRSYEYLKDSCFHPYDHYRQTIVDKFAELANKPVTKEQYARCFSELQGLKLTEIHSNHNIQRILGSEQNAKHFENAIRYAQDQARGKQFVIADPEAGCLLSKLPYEQMAHDMRQFAQRHNLLIVEC